MEKERLSLYKVEWWNHIFQNQAQKERFQILTQITSEWR